MIEDTWPSTKRLLRNEAKALKALLLQGVEDDALPGLPLQQRPSRTMLQEEDYQAFEGCEPCECCHDKHGDDVTL